MEKVKSKLFIGVLFAVFATLVQCIFKYHSDFFNLIIQNLKSIGYNFIIFSLVGYLLLGNILLTKKQS